MAVNVYTGVMGSGKSFEVTLNVVLPAVLNGRRVVTNIEGIDETKIYDYLKLKNPKHEGELGRIVHISDTDVLKAGFFPDMSQVHNQDAAMVQPGDMVVIDEAWRFWSSDKKISPEHMQFFRMHRHYTHEVTGISCDLALVFQAITDVHRSIRSVLEMNFRTTKLKTLGLNSSYRIEFWEGGKQTKTAFVGRRVTRYDKAIFPLYKSYAGSDGKEASIDSRQNVLKNPSLWFTVVTFIIISGYAVWWLWWFLHPAPASVPAATRPLESMSPTSHSSSSVSDSSSRPTGLSSVNRRIGGSVTLPDARLVIVLDRDGRFFYDVERNYTGQGIFLSGSYKSEKIDVASFPGN